MSLLVKCDCQLPSASRIVFIETLEHFMLFTLGHLLFFVTLNLIVCLLLAKKEALGNELKISSAVRLNRIRVPFKFTSRRNEE